MTINDGFGNPTFEQDLLQWEPFLMKAIDRLALRSDPRWDDLLQEARIEFWRAYESLAEETPEDRRRFALHRARRHVGKVANPARYEKPTGQEHRVERQVDEAFSLDALENPDMLLGLAEALDLIERAYHQNEIMVALRTLPIEQQRYVVHRFWLGYGDTEIARSLGVTRDVLTYQWRKNVRPLLAERLAHLAAA